MNQEVSSFIEELKQPWQVEACNQLREMVHQTVPSIDERIQYKKPHFLKDGKYAAVISTAKDTVTFMIFNTTNLDLSDGKFEGPVERRWMKFREGDPIDLPLLAKVLTEASSTL
ncbi:DUF1801 domain-containing protein [Paenibacillus sp. BC26]|uniref:DUF1801 domain-containing protein n=1 Tax=Paenibacillus sp. BC26 TaxID=1881032 RepID=UPI0008F06D39|nr:DUF1801 domain-containing protein [Paenibacillus sp. BC26]SFS70736.1 hypothetical protein SAMN05428962_2397 [Paenibacillus sp. BC26]